MRRGEIWTVAAGSGYGGKPRPAVIVQDDRFDDTDSITVCLVTTDPTEAPLLRLRIDPSPLNGLQQTSSIMVDKIVTTRRKSLGDQLGRLGGEDLVRLGRAMVVFLGLAD